MQRVPSRIMYRNLKCCRPGMEAVSQVMYKSQSVPSKCCKLAFQIVSCYCWLTVHQNLKQTPKKANSPPHLKPKGSYRDGWTDGYNLPQIALETSQKSLIPLPHISPGVTRHVTSYYNQSEVAPVQTCHKQTPSSVAFC